MVALPVAEFLADVAAVYIGDAGRGSFGSGRLIAPGLVLTAGHVVDYPSRAMPVRTGWKVALLASRARDGSWAFPAYKAELIWRGRDDLDLALLHLTDGTGVRPAPTPVFASYDRHGPIAAVDAAGFPQARVDAARAVNEYSVRGILRIAGQLRPYAWSVSSADKPDDPHGWEGMSGAAACCVLSRDELYVFGALQQVPANFSGGQLDVARISGAFEDPSFCRHLEEASGALPLLVPFAPEGSEGDFGIARILRSQLQAITEEYLVSETGPVPFGGRDAEIDRLNAWLLDPGAAPRMLVTAPAGRGKSALLVQWMKLLQDGGILAPDEWQLAFVPISIRIGTNRPEVFHEGLARRLAEIAREPLPGEGVRDIDSSTVRSLVERVSGGGRKIIIVVDGLDEALHGSFNPAILPAALPANLRVLMSARWQRGDSDSEGWLRRLAWDRSIRVESFVLDPLKSDGIVDVLVKLGAPLDDAAGDPALVRRLLELTEGEPLLVRYYAEDLWQLGRQAAPITRAELDQLKPGFGSYFERWFDRQEALWRAEKADIDRNNVDRVLAVLAFALGPLTEAEMLDLFRHIYGPTDILSAVPLLEPLRRFVIGNGKRGSGYVLSHPKIGGYLQEERFAAGANGLRSKFAGWGRALLADLNRGRVRPEQVSHYALQFLTHHFDAARVPPADFVELVADGWRGAWEGLEGTDSGFARDVNKVWGVLKNHGRERERLRDAGVGMGGQIRCALCLSSMSTRALDIPADLLATCLRYGVLTARQALGSLQINPSHTWRAEALLEILPYLPQEDLAEHLPWIFANLSRDKSSFACRLVDRLRPDQFDAIVDMLAVTGDEGLQAFLLSWCASHLSTSRLGEATAIARAIRDPDGRSQALRALALESSLPPDLRQSLLAEALTAARLAGEKAERALRLHVSARAPQWMGPNSPPILADVLTDIRDRPRLFSLIVGAAGPLSAVDRATIAEEALAAASTDHNMASLVIDLLSDLPAEKLGEAIRLAQALKEIPSERARLLAAVSERAAGDDPSLISEVVVALCDGTPKSRRDRILSELAAKVTSGGSASTIAAACLNAAHTRGITLCSARIFAFVSSIQAEWERTEGAARALNIAREVSFAWDGGSGGVELEVEYETALDRDKRPGRAQALADIIPLLPPDQRSPALAEALRSARALPMGTWTQGRAHALTQVARTMPESMRQSVVVEAIAAAESIYDEIDRTDALVRLGDLLSPGLTRQAIAAAQKICSVDRQSEVLASFAGYVSDVELRAPLAACLAEARRLDDEMTSLEAVNTLQRFTSGQNVPAPREAPDAADVGPRSPAEKREYEGIISDVADRILREERTSTLRDRDWSGDEQLVGLLLNGLRRASGELRPKIVSALLAVVRIIDHASNQRGILQSMAPLCEPDEAVQAWQLAAAIRIPEYRVEALAAISGRLPQSMFATALEEMIAPASRLRRRLLLAALAQSASVIFSVGGDTVVREVIASIRDVQRWWP